MSSVFIQLLWYQIGNFDQIEVEILSSSPVVIFHILCLCVWMKGRKGVRTLASGMWIARVGAIRSTASKIQKSEDLCFIIFLSTVECRDLSCVLPIFGAFCRVMETGRDPLSRESGYRMATFSYKESVKMSPVVIGQSGPQCRLEETIHAAPRGMTS